jgi:ATP-dependent Clp protease ATP-binding subunit ClpA
MQLSNDVEFIMNNAMSMANDYKNEYILPEHILFIIMDNNDIFDNQDAIQHELETFLKTKIPVLPPNRRPVESAGFTQMIKTALHYVEQSKRNTITVGDILVAIWDIQGQAKYILAKCGIDKDKIIETAEDLGSSDIEDDEENDGAQMATANGAPNNKKSKHKFLDKFTIEMVQQAKDGKYDPIIGRNDEVERTIQILCRKKKNNPIHVGLPGTGKTAISEGLAQRIANNTVPDILKDYKIYSLDMGGLLSGTKYRGDFEERIKGIVKEIEAEDKAIIYIDEIHNIIGAGSGSQGTMDASNILRPSLQSGKFKVIGSTTYDDYKKVFERDAALARRFQKIDILEPSEAETFEILKGLKENYEKFHNVKYTDDVLLMIAKLSHQYINDRQLPDKAIDVMDEVGSLLRVKNFVAGQQSSVTCVTENDVEKVLSKITKLPEQTVSTNETEKLQLLEPKLKEKVFGQDEAIHEIVRVIKKSRINLKKKDQPIASLFFAGKTGVGKTYLIQKLAEEMGISFLRYDMSEMTEAHSVSRLIGSQPGYVGYGDNNGLLIDDVREHPHSIILFDEIEKAHQNIFNLLLQVMDHGSLTSSTGMKADFTNTLIVFTSNVGAKNIGKKLVGFGTPAEGIQSADAIGEDYKKAFAPEFRNRVSKLIIFNSLSENSIKQIVLTEIKEFESMLLERNIKLSFNDEVISWFVKNGYSDEFGARNINRLIDEKLKSDDILDSILFGDLKDGGHVSVEIKDDDIHILTLNYTLDNSIVSSIKI